MAVDLAKSVYQVAESVRFGQVSQRKRLNREAFRRYVPCSCVTPYSA